MPGSRTVLCNVATPRMNAIAERWIGGCRRELPDRALVWNHSHLRRILRDYEVHHNQHRPQLPARRRAAETATRTDQSRSLPRPKTGSCWWPDQRISPGRMTWTRFSARTVFVALVPGLSAWWGGALPRGGFIARSAPSRAHGRFVGPEAWRRWRPGRRGRL